MVSFRSPGPCVATLLNQLTLLARGHSSAGPLQPAPVVCEMRPLVVSDPLLNITALQLWTHTSTEEQKDCKSETQQGQL